MEAKGEVLSYVEECGPVDSQTVALALGFAVDFGGCGGPQSPKSNNLTSKLTSSDR